MNDEEAIAIGDAADEICWKTDLCLYQDDENQFCWDHYFYLPTYHDESCFCSNFSEFKCLQILFAFQQLIKVNNTIIIKEEATIIVIEARRVIVSTLVKIELTIENKHFAAKLQANKMKDLDLFLQICLQIIKSSTYYLEKELENEDEMKCERCQRKVSGQVYAQIRVLAFR